MRGQGGNRFFRAWNAVKMEETSGAQFVTSLSANIWRPHAGKNDGDAVMQPVCVGSTTILRKWFVWPSYSLRYLVLEGWRRNETQCW